MEEKPAQEKYPKWFKPKGYLHLMPKITAKDYYWVKKYVSNKEKISSYTFYPFIHRTIKTRRYKKLNYNNCELKPYRSHINIETEKSTAKEREIHYPNHLDGLIYSYYAQEILSKKYENRLKEIDGLSDCITAYRKIKSTKNPSKGKCNIHFAIDVFNHIREIGNCSALTFDVKNFFPSLDHSYLKKMWINILEGNNDSVKLPPDHFNIFKSLTKFWYVEEDDLLKEHHLFKYERGKRRRQKSQKLKSYCKDEKDFRSKICSVRNKTKKSLLKKSEFEKNKGIPQGTQISALLANMYLYEFDKLIFDKIKDIEGALYRRYSDDIIIVCPQKIENDIKKFIEKNIADCCNLKMNTNKTEVVRFQNNQIEDLANPLKYLGLEFDGKKILLKSSSLSKYHRRMRFFVKRKFRKAKRMKLENQEDTKVWRNQILQKYTKKGKRNFISYALKAEAEVGENSISNQIKSHRKFLSKYLKKRSNK